MLTAVLIVASVALALSLGTAILAIVLLTKQNKPLAHADQEEINRQLGLNNDSLVQMLGLHNQTVDDNLRKTLSYAQENTERQNRQTEELSAKTAEKLDAMSKTLAETLSAQRMEMTAGINALRESMESKQAEQVRSTAESLAGLRTELNTQLNVIREQNAKEMNDMRSVVDKQLHENLENRLTQSFGLVTDKLQEVYKGLGEMSALTTDVKALKNVLSGVKTRGTWGEISLRSLLEQLLVPEQYVTNFHASRSEGGVVEFAIKMPGGDGSPVYLPVDSKFPMEDYQRLVEAAQTGDQAAVEACAKALENRVKSEAQDIRDKYLRPPKTTDFGILYLPVEGLFAEVTRNPGLVEQLQSQYRVIVAGPTTLAALLNSLQVGFRTLAIQKRSKEVWDLLAKVKRQFELFGEDLHSAQKQLALATKSLEKTDKHSQTIAQKLKDIQLPESPLNQDDLPQGDPAQEIAASSTQDEDQL